MPAGIAAPAPGPERHLRPVDRFVRVPLGFLWLIVLALLAVPVTVYMTLLYYLVQGAKLLLRRPSRRASGSGSAEERVA